MKSKFKWRIAGSRAHVPPLVNEMLETLRGAFGKLNKEDHCDIKLILSELIYNAVLHGNKSDENKSVHVDLSITENAINVTIADEGIGFNTDAAMLHILNSEYLKLENGRGIALASALADELFYSDEGRRVTFLKRIGPSAAGDKDGNGNF